MKSQIYNISIKDSLELDPSILYGRLNNGFTYYIKQLNDATSTDMKLWVKAGTFNQTKEQSIAAHLIEHLPFRSTKNFPGTNIKLNPKFKKYHINNMHGRTIMIHTEYSIRLPKLASMDAISTGLLWYQDIGKMNVSSYDIKKEAGILRQEMLNSSGDIIEWNFSNSERESHIFSCNADLSTFFNDVQTISPNQVEKFYKKWYRPDRMGLVIIGNIQDLTALENQIKSIFSKIPLPDSTNPTCDCEEVYLRGKRKFVIVEKKPTGWINEENPPVEVFLNYRKKDSNLRKPYSKEALKRSLICRAIEKLINYRSKAYDINYILTNQRKREKPFLQISFKDRNGMEKIKIQKTIQLLAQINTFGLTSKEWSLIQNDLLQRLTNRANTNNISYWESQLKNHFLYHETLPSNKLDVIKGIIQVMTTKDINKYISENFKANPDDISMLVPENNKALSFTELEVRNWIYQALEKPTFPFESPSQNSKQSKKEKDVQVLSQIDFTKLPLVGILNIEKDQNTGTKIMTLDNGIRIVLNKREAHQTKNGNIKIHAFTPVGAKCFPEEDYFSAINAPSLIQNKSIRKKVRAYIDNFTAGIKTTVNINSLESIFQSIYYNFKFIPLPTSKNFKQWKEIANLNYFNPSFNLMLNDFLEYRQAYLGGDNTPPRATKRFYGIKNTDPKKAYAIYKQLLGNASNYTFIISGNFTNSQIIPLLQKYLGNLPVQENKQLDNCDKSYKAVKSPLPTAPLYKIFYLEDIKPVYNLKNVQYDLSYRIQTNEDFWNWKKRIKLIILSKFIQPRLKNLRYEKKAGLYGINFSSTSFNYTLRTSKISIRLACQENEIAWLKQECYEIIDSIKTNGILQKEFEEVIKNQVLPYYTTGPYKKPKSSEIYDYFRLGAPIANKQEQEEFVRSLTPLDIQEIAREYFKVSNQYEFVMKNNRSGINVQ